MGMVYAATVAVALWVALWALGASAIDASLPAILILLLAVAVMLLSPSPREQD